MWLLIGGLIVFVVICVTLFVMRFKLFYKCEPGYIDTGIYAKEDACMLDVCAEGKFVRGTGCVACPKGYSLVNDHCEFRQDCNALKGGTFYHEGKCYGCPNGYFSLPGKKVGDPDACVKVNLLTGGNGPAIMAHQLYVEPKKTQQTIILKKFITNRQ